MIKKKVIAAEISTLYCDECGEEMIQTGQRKHGQALFEYRCKNKHSVWDLHYPTIRQIKASN